MRYLVGILLFGLAWPANELQAQYRLSGHSLPELRRVELLPPSIPSISFGQNFLLRPYRNAGQAPGKAVSVRRPIPAAWSPPELAFFCRLEVRLEKASSFPVKFRIGEVQYAENREGKYGRLQQQIGH